MTEAESVRLGLEIVGLLAVGFTGLKYLAGKLIHAIELLQDLNAKVAIQNGRVAASELAIADLKERVARAEGRLDER